jgi:hypothetical protein
MSTRHNEDGYILFADRHVGLIARREVLTLSVAGN